jgi:hypothetical protein
VAEREVSDGISILKIKQKGRKISSESGLFRK